MTKESKKGVVVNRPLPQAFATRRTFLRGSLGTMVAAAATASLAACGGTSDDSGSDAGASGEGTEEKVLRVGLNNPKTTFDTQQTSTTWGASENVCDTLITLNPETLELEPNLVTGLPEVSDDGLTYSFELKDGVKFHDGTTLKASDVKYTLTRLIKLNEQADSYIYIAGSEELQAGSTDELAGVEVQDDTHFTITLSSVYSSFPYMLAEFYASIYPEAACEAAGEAWGSGTNLIGTGPFKLASNDDQTEVVLEANPDYHQGKPALDKVVVTYIDDANTRMMNYKNDDIDLCNIDISLLEQYTNDADVKDQIVYYTPASTQFVNINLNDERLANKDLRQAMSLAINRPALCDTVLAGAAEPCSGFITPTETASDKDAEPFEYDPDKAKELVANCGITDLNFTAEVRSQDQAVMIALQNYWSQIGINIEVQVIDAGLWRQERADGTLLLSLVTWSTLSFVGVEHMGSYFRSDKAAQKSSFYNSATFDELVDKARATNDVAESEQYTIQADRQLCREDYGTIPVDWPQQPYVLRQGFDGLEVLVNFHYKNMTKA